MFKFGRVSGALAIGLTYFTGQGQGLHTLKGVQSDAYDLSLRSDQSSVSNVFNVSNHSDIYQAQQSLIQWSGHTLLNQLVSSKETVQLFAKLKIPGIGKKNIRLQKRLIESALALNKYEGMQIRTQWNRVSPQNQEKILKFVNQQLNREQRDRRTDSHVENCNVGNVRAHILETYGGGVQGSLIRKLNTLETNLQNAQNDEASEAAVENYNEEIDSLVEEGLSPAAANQLKFVTNCGEDRTTPAPTPGPTPAPIPEPTPAPTPQPSPEPSPQPTPAPSHEPSTEPTQNPSPEPSPQPTPAPSPEPSQSPSQNPSPEPSPQPTPAPSHEPNTEPTQNPSPEPTPEPTPEPSQNPSPEPSPSPSQAPSQGPSFSSSDGTSSTDSDGVIVGSVTGALILVGAGIYLCRQKLIASNYSIEMMQNPTYVVPTHTLADGDDGGHYAIPQDASADGEAGALYARPQDAEADAAAHGASNYSIEFDGHKVEMFLNPIYGDPIPTLADGEAGALYAIPQDAAAEASPYYAKVQTPVSSGESAHSALIYDSKSIVLTKDDIDYVYIESDLVKFSLGTQVFILTEYNDSPINTPDELIDILETNDTISVKCELEVASSTMPTAGYYSTVNKHRSH